MHQITKKNYFKNGKVYVWKETFAIIKSKKVYPNAFVNIIGKNETTVIIEQSKYNNKDVIEIKKDWKNINILVKEKDLARAEEKLKQLGCVVEEK